MSGFYHDRYGFYRDDANPSFWVNPSDRRTKAEHPYSYSEFFIFGGPLLRLKDCDAVYSDRLFQWSPDDWTRAHEAVPKPKRFEHFSRDELSKFLTAYYQREIHAEAMAEGCNVSNGYPYWVFWFRDTTRKQDAALKAARGES